MSCVAIPFQPSLFPDPSICRHGEHWLSCDECSGYTGSRFYKAMIAALGYDLRDRSGVEATWL